MPKKRMDLSRERTLVLFTRLIHARFDPNWIIEFRWTIGQSWFGESNLLSYCEWWTSKATTTWICQFKKILFTRWTRGSNTKFAKIGEISSSYINSCRTEQTKIHEIFFLSITILLISPEFRGHRSLDCPDPLNFSISISLSMGGMQWNWYLWFCFIQPFDMCKYQKPHMLGWCHSNVNKTCWIVWKLFALFFLAVRSKKHQNMFRQVKNECMRSW